MERKRSPRSSPGILPKSPLMYGKYKAGCAWRLINLFDFRQGWSGKRLISDKSHGVRDSAGNVYTKSQLQLLQRLHEKCQCTNNANANDQWTVEEEISRKPKTKRRSSVPGTEHEKSDPKRVWELPNNEIRSTKNLKQDTFDSLVQAQGKVVFSEQKQSSLTAIEKSRKTPDKQLGLKKGWDRSCKNVDPDLEKCPEINLHVRVNEAAEALICQKVKKGKVFGRDKGSDRSKQFLEALDVLSSNKELFVTLLQDPKSFSAKCGQDLLGSQPIDQEAKSSSKAESFETHIKELGESDDLDRIVLLKPRLTSSGGDNACVRFKHLARKLKLVVGSNRKDHREIDFLHSICSPEDGGETRKTETSRTTSDATKRMEKTSYERDSQWRSDASTSSFGHRSPELPVFKRKKRVESDVFKLSTENDVFSRRLMVERQHDRTSSLPVYEVPHALSSFMREHDGGVSPETRFKERNQRLGNEKQRYSLRSPGKNIEVFNLKHSYYLRSSDVGVAECLDEDVCRGSAAYSNLKSDIGNECVEQRYSQSSCAKSCHSTILETNTLFSDFSSPERPNSKVNDLKQEQEHPSPVSVLERIHLEDDTTSSGNVKPPSTEEQIGVCSDPSIDLRSICERGSVQEFVKIVLETSGLNWTELLAKCTVSSPNSSLLDQFAHNNNGDHHQRLVLDYASEILHETYRQDIKSWPFIPLKNPNLSLFLWRNDLFHLAMKHFDWSLLCDSGPRRTLDQHMEKDLVKPCVWMDFGGETEGVVVDVVEQLLEQLEMEMVRELGTMPIRISKFLQACSTFL